MIIRCPSCDTQYDLPAGTIGEAGRMVSCARCKERWLARAEAPMMDEPEPAVQIVEPFDVDDVGFEDIDTPEDTGDIEAQPQIAEASPAAPATAMAATPGAEPRPQSSGGLTKRRVVIKRKAQPRRFSGHAMVMGVAIAMVFCGVWMRESVVMVMPRTAALYDLIGLPVNLVGLDFDSLAWSQENDNGTPVLVVTGRIVNVSDMGAYVPAIRLGLADSQNQELFAWTTDPPAEILQPGGTTAFTTRLASPPGDAANVSVRFTPRAPKMSSMPASKTMGMKQ